MPLTRKAATSVRRFADRTSTRLAAVPSGEHLRAVVDSVTAGGAADGVAAAVTVKWRGETLLPVNDYPDSYTPAVNHPVLCVLVDGQLSILHHCIGQP